MPVLDKKKNNKNIIIFIIFLVCLLGGIYSAKFFQPKHKSYNIYQQALRDYDNGNYSNSYFLFSKIGYTSQLKPFAIYRQALCARALADKKSELNRYQLLFRVYPSNKLSLEAKYQAAQLLIDTDPSLARRYFDFVFKTTGDSDYKIASEYYKARIAAAKIRYSNRISSRAKISDIELSFRKYLEEAPGGRLAVNAANTWLKFNPNINSKDAVLVARAYYLAGLYDDASSVFSKSKLQDNWAVQAANLYKKGDYAKVKAITEQGVAKYSENVNADDYKRAVDVYLKIYDNAFPAILKLFSTAKGKGKDYIWNLKCDNSPVSSRAACYKDLYVNYPSGEYSSIALLNMFFDRIRQKDYLSAKKIGLDFVAGFPDAEQAPMVMYWLGKIEQRYYNNSNSIKYYQEVINKYPDSYYAYRAFWLLNGLETATISANIDYKPVVYPYKYPARSSALYSLLKVKDYDMVEKYTQDDFIKSWVEYQQGNYSVSAYLAQEAMDKLSLKPPKNDLRWRLVYPQNYYMQVKKYAEQYNNDTALMMAIVREESHFNSEAQSSVGAIGLMQLMPATAHDIGAKHGISFNTSYLVNPELNIRFGNLYYSTIRGMLNNKDVSSIAAYNGGIGSVTRWKSTLKYSDTDEFVEQIPYEETKNYVKKVFKSYWNYIRIYQH